MATSVQLLATCLVDSLFPDVGVAVVQVLNRAGVLVEFPQGQTCCGQPAYNAGYQDEAKKMALHTLEVFEETSGPVVIPSGSCTAMIRYGYPQLFQDDVLLLKRVDSLSRRTFELSEFLVNELRIDHFGFSIDFPLAYHPSCHLFRGIGIDREPRALLDHACNSDVIYLEPDCCGFGGFFAIDQPELSGEMLLRKIAAVGESGAQVVVGGDVSCLMHLEGGLRKLGSPIRCAHLAQMLAGQEPGLK